MSLTASRRRGNRARATAARGPAAAAALIRQRARRAARASAPLDQLRQETPVERRHQEGAYNSSPSATAASRTASAAAYTEETSSNASQHCLCHQWPTAPACRAGPRPSDTRPRPPRPALGQVHTRRPNPRKGRRRRPLYHHNLARGAPRTPSAPARARRGRSTRSEMTHGLV